MHSPVGTTGNGRFLLRLVALSTVFVAAMYSSITAVVDAADSTSNVLVKTFALSITIIVATSCFSELLLFAPSVSSNASTLVEPGILFQLKLFLIFY